MKGLPWYKARPANFLTGMRGLSLEERGAYRTLLDMIYDAGGPIPDEDWRICAELDCTPKVWAKVRASLIEKRKIFAVVINTVPSLMNATCAEVLEKTRKISEKLSDAGRKGGENSSRKLNENNENPKPRLDEGLSQAQASKIEEGEKERDVPKGTSASAPNDPDRDAWTEAVRVLREQGGMPEPSARKLFGSILKRHQLEPRDLLASLTSARVNGTLDPQGYISAAAKAVADRRNALTEMGNGQRIDTPTAKQLAREDNLQRGFAAFGVAASRVRSGESF